MACDEIIYKGNKYSEEEFVEMMNSGEVPVDGEPVVTGKDDKGKSYLYKQINAWGDGNRAQEYYDIPQSSVLAMHEKVTEVPDAELIKKYGIGSVKSVEDNKNKLGFKKGC